MHLSIAELARLEAMFAEGKVRSDPPRLSATDRLLDAMMLAARHRTGPANGASVSTGAGLKAKSAIARVSEQDWDLPRTLEQLIEIRRSLMGDGDPKP
jgi:hypothetical protein